VSAGHAECESADVDVGVLLDAVNTAEALHQRCYGQCGCVGAYIDLTCTVEPSDACQHLLTRLCFSFFRAAGAAWKSKKKKSP